MNNKKGLLLLSLLIVFVASGSIASTAAFLSSRKTVAVNKFTIGTLDLDVSSSGNALEPIVIDGLGADGGISGSKTWEVRNKGTLAGQLFVELRNVTNSENGCNNPERDAEPNCELDDTGELGSVIAVELFLDDELKAQSSLTAAWNLGSPIILNPGESRNVTVKWSASDADYGNEVQSDSVEFDIGFDLLQLTEGAAQN